MPSLQQDGTVFASNLDKAEVLNEYFFSVFTVDDQKQNVPADMVVCKDTFENLDSDVVEVFEVLRMQSLKCSHGPDGIPHIVIVGVRPFFRCPFTLFFEVLC